MAKTKHNQLLDTVDEIFTDAKNKGVMHLYLDDDGFDGRHLSIDGQKLFHFGTTSYMGFDQDIRLKEASVRAILKYGTQFPLSKAYLSHSLYRSLEESLEQMFGNPVVVAKNSTLAHLGVIPSVVRDEDAVILDHQVHNSVQNACNLLKVRGISVEIIRHNRLDMLEEAIVRLRDKHEKIWYMIDGVYSMYGDFSPIHDIVRLLNEHPQLYLYADDVHGMSWTGPNGTGFLMSELKELHEKMILITTLGKSFGASGAVMVTSNKEMSRYVKTFGGSLSFSAQMEPANVAAALASTHIHLSPEIYELQNELAGKISYCNELLTSTNLPLYVNNRCPLFYIATGLPSAGFNLASRLRKDGFYVNLGIFPAVPVKNTGVRFTVSRHNEKEDIKQLVQALEHHFPLMLEDEGQTHNQVRKSFKMPLLEEDATVNKTDEKIKVELHTSIKAVDAAVWDKYLGEKGMFDANIMAYYEEVFTNNEKKEDNWKFYYQIVKDQNNEVILMALITVSLWKEDMLSIPEVSKKVEDIRKNDPYYLTSQVVQLGTLITDGDHLYVNTQSQNWEEAVKVLFSTMEKLQDENDASMIVLRDFLDQDDVLRKFITDKGFIKINMPDISIIEPLQFSTEEEFVSRLSYRSRRHFKKEIDRYKDVFTVEYRYHLTEEEKKKIYNLYTTVKRNNLDINNFEYPYKIIDKVCNYKDFVVVVVKVKDEYKIHPDDDIVAFSIGYKNSGDSYNGLIIGMDYQYQENYKVYRNVIYQLIIDANNKKCNKFYLGFSASREKRKFGATIIPKIAFVQAKDNYTLELIESISAI